jgi:hypothetical protein
MSSAVMPSISTRGFGRSILHPRRTVFCDGAGGVLRQFGQVGDGDALVDYGVVEPLAGRG